MEKKPKILLLVNVPGWAFDMRANQMIAELSPYFNFTKEYSIDLKKDPTFDYNNFDLIFIFYWPDRAWLNIKVAPKKIIGGIYSYTSWQHCKDELNREAGHFGTLITPTITLLNDLSFINRNMTLIPHAVDTKKFFPAKTSNKNTKLIVGWVGNPDHHDREYKGYWTIVKPVCEKNNDWISLETALSTDQIPHEKMVNFYHKIDVLVCMSKGESGPNPVLEAGACGLAVVSTAVGLVPDLIKNNVNGLIVDRDENSLEKALLFLHENPAIRESFGINLRKTIEAHYSTYTVMQKYQETFDSLLNTN